MEIDFNAALLRLKGALQIQTDKEVATRLGLSPAALNERKKRNSFPVDKVRALAATELFDDVYVITGISRAATEMIHAAKAGTPMMQATPIEQRLLAHWRSATPSDQKIIFDIAARLGIKKESCFQEIPNETK